MSKQQTLLKGTIALVTMSAMSMGGSAAQALTLVQYDFGTPPGTSTRTLAPTTTAANINASNLSAGSGGTLNTFTRTTSPTNNGAEYIASSLATTSAAAVTNNSFFAFTVTPTGGVQLNLNSLSFNADATGPFPGSYASFVLRSSVDSFASNIGTVQTTTSNGNGNPISPMSFSLTAPAYQNLAAPITFRVYVFGETKLSLIISAPARPTFDNVTLDGTSTPITPIPFPFAPLPGLALAWVTGAVRRRMRLKNG